MKKNIKNKVIGIVFIIIAVVFCAYIYLNKKDSLNQKSHLDSSIITCDVLHQDQRINGIELPQTCVQDIGKNVLVYVEFSNEKVVIKNADQKIIFTKDIDPDFGADSLVYWFDDDVNFDGYQDVFIGDMAAYNLGGFYYVYIPESNGQADGFKILETDALVNHSFDHKSKTITSYNKGRGLGDIFTIENYSFINGKYVLVSSLYQDLVDWGNPDSDYLEIYKELKNGEMVETGRNIIKKEDIFPSDE